MWPFTSYPNNVVAKPHWANSVLAYNHHFQKCAYSSCERIIKDGSWFKIKKENNHYLVFDTEHCEISYDDKFGAKPE